MATATRGAARWPTSTTPAASPDQLGIDHPCSTSATTSTATWSTPTSTAIAAGRTPNPCIECNRHLKFDRLLRRAEALGFDAVATGHHARVAVGADGVRRVRRGADAAKDQSYVLYMLTAAQLERVMLPVGGLTKSEVRAEAARLGLRTADKPDSQDVCFITAAGGRRTFLGDRIPLTPARVVDTDGVEVGAVDAVELVTVGQRRGLGLAGGGDPRYALAVDAAAGTVTVGADADLLDDGVALAGTTWTSGRPPVPGTEVVAQCSAHGRPRRATVDDGVGLRWHRPERRVAPGQSVVVYDGELVLGGGIVT